VLRGRPRRAVETLRAIPRFFERHSSTGRGPRIVAVATSAVRDADHPERLLGPLRRREGITVQVLSTREEAQLGVDAALDSLPFTNGIVADLGWRQPSAQPRPRPAARLQRELAAGGGTRTRRFSRQDPPRPRELQAIRRAIRQALVDAVPPADRGEVIVGLGGIVRTLARIHLRSQDGDRKHRHGLRLAQSDVTAIRERLEGSSRRQRRKIRGL
jgi:exopolyphosphatase/guanosine-5'-triphosphate,3'-diphosphate pyrophosphatase